MSHPIWVRGLKHIERRKAGNRIMSHPIWVRGLKLNSDSDDYWLRRSHPIWVRGLKHTSKHTVARHSNVAPYMGAWIETS